jgi:hypothetical protein
MKKIYRAHRRYSPKKMYVRIPLFSPPGGYLPHILNPIDRSS